MDSGIPSNQHNSWQEVRLFISSTFRDMQSERDYLVRYVFPKVREELFKRHIYFVDIDLRWGLTSEDDIVGACQSIIDECRPLFLGILGGRYGWIPKDIPKPVSVTEDEIEYAIQNINAAEYGGVYFLFRDDISTLSVPEPFRKEYLEPEGSESARKSNELKRRILSSGFQVDYYNAVWNAAAGRLSGLEIFGSLVYEYIMRFVENKFGHTTPQCIDSDSEEDSTEELFISQHNRFFITSGLEEVFDTVQSAACMEKENNLILLTGESGTGKSSFLCKLIENMRSDGRVRVLHHFIGVAPNSSSLSGMLRRLCRIFSSESGSREPIPLDIDKLIICFQQLLIRANHQIHYILIIDGLNQLQPDNNSYELLWIPQYIPSNITLILSSIPHPLVEAMSKRWANLKRMELNGLKANASYTLVKYYLSRYQKHLSMPQIELLLKKAESHMPLYLSTAIEELRIYGNYDRLSLFIQSMPENTVSLLEWILGTRLMHSSEFTDDSGQCISELLVPRYLTFLYISQSGLSETELSQVLESGSKRGNTAAITRQLRNFLTLRGELLNFYHDAMRTAVFNAFVRDADLKDFHEELSSYFRSKADPSGDSTWLCDSVRPYAQLLYHGIQAGDLKALDSLALSGFLEKYSKIGTPEAVLREIKTVVHMFSEDTEDEHWDAVLRCVRVYAETARFAIYTGLDKPHPLEIAILEGRDEDAATILNSASYGMEASVLRCAARVLYNASGRVEKARAIEAFSSEAPRGSFINSTEVSVLFSALSHQEENPPGKSKKDDTQSAVLKEETDNGSLNQSADISARYHIPVWQSFALSATGKFKYIFFAIAGTVCIGLVCFIYIKLHFFDIMNSIQNWKTSLTLLKKILDFIISGLLGIGILAVPYCTVRLIYGKLKDMLEHKAGQQVLAMSYCLYHVKQNKKLTMFIRLTKYGCLLNKSKISESSYSNLTAAHILSSEISSMLLSSKIKDAGLAAGCVMNLDSLARDSVAQVFCKLPDDMLYQVMQSMLTHRYLFIDPVNVLDFMLKVYGSTPPTSLLMNALSLQNRKDEEAIADHLYTVSRPVLARCLLRFTSVLKNSSTKALFRRIGNFIGRELCPIPVDISFRELIVKVPYLIVILLVLYVAAVLILAISGIVPYYSFILLPYPIYCLCKYWNKREKISEDIEIYPIFHFEGYLSDSVPLKQRFKRGGISIVETAIVDSLLEGTEKPEYILGSFPEKTVLHVWESLLYPGRINNRAKILLPVMEDNNLLSKIISRIPSWNTGHGQPIDDVIHQKQWRRVRPVYPKWASAVTLIIITALTCALSMLMLFGVSDKWLRLLIIYHGWIGIIPAVFAGLIPIPKIRYLTVFLIPFFTYLSLGRYIPFKAFTENEMVIYSLLPSLSVLLASMVIDRWRSANKVYPAKHQAVAGRLKSVCILLAGSFGICVFIILALRSADFIGDVAPAPQMNEVYILKDYSAAMHWPEIPPNLHKRTLIDIANWPLDWDPYSIYGSNLSDRVYKGSRLYDLELTLHNLKYEDETLNCQKRLYKYVGWVFALKAQVDGSPKTIFIDNNGRQVVAVPVIVGIHSKSQALSLGMELGDIIQSINGKPIVYPEDIIDQMTAPVDGTGKVSITVRRMDKIIQFTASPGDLGITIGYINTTCLEK